MLCLIILTFKHENSFWLVLKCIHDLLKKNIQNNNKKTKKTKIERKKIQKKSKYL
jgi:hypothetical protein